MKTIRCYKYLYVFHTCFNFTHIFYTILKYIICRQCAFKQYNYTCISCAEKYVSKEQEQDTRVKHFSLGHIDLG